MRHVATVLALFAVTLGVSPAAAQGVAEPLFATFNFKIEGSWVFLTTRIRLDSESLGNGKRLTASPQTDYSSAVTSLRRSRSSAKHESRSPSASESEASSAGASMRAHASPSCR